jgi:hypothetical protein
MSYTLATAIIRELVHKIILCTELTMLSFRAGNISSALCISILAFLTLDPHLALTPLSHITVCKQGKKMAYKIADKHKSEMHALN